MVPGQANPCKSMGFFIIDPGFPLGKVVATAAIIGLNLDIYALLDRHKYGDFGDLSDEDKSHNYSGLHHGFPIRSLYYVPTPTGTYIDIYVETNGDRTETLICLVDEY